MPLKSHHYTLYNGCTIQILHTSEAKNIKPACCMHILLKRDLPLHALPCYQNSFNSLRNTQSLPECIPHDTNIQVLRLTKQPCERDNRGISLTIPDCRMHIDWRSDSVPLCCHAGVSCFVYVCWITAGCVMQTCAWAGWVVEQAEQRSSFVLSTVSIDLFGLWWIYVICVMDRWMYIYTYIHTVFFLNLFFTL